MKKAGILLAGLTFFAVLSFSSCKKECTCKTYVDGVEMSSTTTEVDGKCADLNTSTTTLGITTEVKCE